jgi:hypothetical protein
MKFIVITLFVISAFIATPLILNKSVETPVVEKQEVVKDSISWFEKNLDLYIQADYFSFDPTNYIQELTPEAKAELSLECWLGNFTIGDMFKEKNCVKVDFSKQDVKKVLFITPTFFVLTSYLISENGMSYGSSLIYSPKTNTLKELESLIVLSVDDNMLQGSKEQFSPVDGYVIERGYYDVIKETFIVEFTE